MSWQELLLVVSHVEPYQNMAMGIFVEDVLALALLSLQASLPEVALAALATLVSLRSAPHAGRPGGDSWCNSCSKGSTTHPQ